MTLERLDFCLARYGNLIPRSLRAGPKERVISTEYAELADVIDDLDCFSDEAVQRSDFTQHDILIATAR